MAFLLCKQGRTKLIFSRGGQNDCSLMLYQKIENVFEYFGRGKIARLPSSSLWDLLARLVSVT